MCLSLKLKLDRLKTTRKQQENNKIVDFKFGELKTHTLTMPPLWLSFSQELTVKSLKPEQFPTEPHHREPWSYHWTSMIDIFVIWPADSIQAQVPLGC